MNKEFIPYEQSLELKELGFDEPCLATTDQTGFIPIEGTKHPIRGAMWYDTIDAPLYQQAFRWFKDKHNMLSTIYSNASGFLYEWSDTIGGTHRGWSDCEGPNNGGVWDTYEEAELACLKKLIEIVKNK